MFDGDVNGSRRIGKLILLYSNIHLKMFITTLALLAICVCFTILPPQPKRSPTKALTGTQILFAEAEMYFWEAFWSNYH